MRSFSEGSSAYGAGPLREAPHGRRDLSARQPRVPCGAHARGGTEAAVWLAPAGGKRRPDRYSCRRRGDSGQRVSGAREPGARAAAHARQEDDGERDPARGDLARGRSQKNAVAHALVAEGRP